MAGNRAIAYMGPRKLEIQNLDYPKLVGPGGRKCDHGVIIKLIVTNICGSVIGHQET
jgi:glutathione-independent formaldehyde dehydrogenase